MSHFKHKETAKYKALMTQIAEHGAQVVEILEPDWNKGQTINRERVLILLEMMFQKAVDGDGSLSAAMAYLDRAIGKPKDNMTIDVGNDTVQQLTDDQLIDKISQILAKSRQADPGSSDK